MFDDEPGPLTAAGWIGGVVRRQSVDVAIEDAEGRGDEDRIVTCYVRHAPTLPVRIRGSQ